MFVSVMQHVTALAEGLQIAPPVVAGVVVAVSGGQEHFGRERRGIAWRISPQTGERPSPSRRAAYCALRPTCASRPDGSPRGQAAGRNARSAHSPGQNEWTRKSVASRSGTAIGAGGVSASALPPDARAESRRVPIKGRDAEAQALGGSADRNLRIVQQRERRPDVIGFHLGPPATFAPAGERRL